MGDRRSGETCYKGPMDDIAQLEVAGHSEAAGHDPYQAPGFTVISLDCEISAYAPDDGGDDLPLF